MNINGILSCFKNLIALRCKLLCFFVELVFLIQKYPCVLLAACGKGFFGVGGILLALCFIPCDIGIYLAKALCELAYLLSDICKLYEQRCKLEL